MCLDLRYITRNISLLAILLTACPVFAQREAKVTGKYTYTLTENDNVTIKEAKIKAIELAKAEAIKSEFGMLVVSDFINIDKSENDDFSSTYLSDTSMSVKGDWLGDEKDPAVTMEIANGDILFTAEVWGRAREIVRAATDIKWQVLKDKGPERVETDRFNSGERFYVKFKSPIDGYVAVYLIVGDDETFCLLPYRRNLSGRYEVRGGKEYTFFDRAEDPKATPYNLKTNRLSEANQLVVVYSPNPFTKCTDVSKDPRHPNALRQKDFAKWLLKTQRADKDMVVSRKWITITGSEE